MTDPGPYPLSTKLGCLGGAVSMAVVIGFVWWLL